MREQSCQIQGVLSSFAVKWSGEIRHLEGSQGTVMCLRRVRTIKEMLGSGARGKIGGVRPREPQQERASEPVGGQHPAEQGERAGLGEEGQGITDVLTPHSAGQHSGDE